MMEMLELFEPLDLLDQAFATEVEDLATLSIDTPVNPSCSDDSNDAAAAETDATPAAEAPIPGRIRKKARRIRLNPNKARSERMQEVRGLRFEISKLTTQLTTLRNAAARRGRGCSNQLARTSESTELVGGCRVWEEICRNQLVRRVATETENFRLKYTLDEQRRLSNRLQQVLTKSSIGLVRAAIAVIDHRVDANKALALIPFIAT